MIGRSIEPTQAHVLVVEDSFTNFTFIARMLTRIGVPRCEWKTSGWQVVEFAEKLPRVDLILMDICLPYEDGYQALRKVRANARFTDTRIIAVTSDTSQEQMEAARDFGFDGFLGKPLDAQRFAEQIQRILAGQEVWELY